MTKEEIIQLIDEEDIEFIRLQFVDMFGNLKNIAVTPSQIDRVINNEFFVDASALFDDKYDVEEELYLHPDLDSFVILPWRPQQGRVGKFICDVCKENGEVMDLSPRTILKKVLEKVKEKGYKSIVDTECEFFLFHTDDDGMPTVVSHERAGYMDVGPVDLGENARRDIVLNLEDMGFEIESSHHEKAPAQHEIDFRQNEGLKTADALTTFKFAVRSIAKRFGLYATFMPKPRMNVAGSGLHLNFAILKNGENIFEDNEAQEAKYFVGGILKYAEEMCAITNPIVNSYKRILSGFEAPNKINWATKGEKALVKLRKTFGQMKVELRFPDPSANPYLALAVCIAAGFKGIQDKIDPDELLASWGEEKHLPENLKDAVAALENSEFMKSVLGEEFVRIYCDVKKQEWNDYMLLVSDWELDRYLVKI